MTPAQRHYIHRAIRAVANRHGYLLPGYLADLFGVSGAEIAAALAAGESK